MHLVLGFFLLRLALDAMESQELAARGAIPDTTAGDGSVGPTPNFLVVTYVMQDYECCLRLQHLMIAFMVPSWIPFYFCACLDAATWSYLGLTTS